MIDARGTALLSLLLAALAPAASAQTPTRSGVSAQDVKCGLLTSTAAGRQAGISPTDEVASRAKFRIEKQTDNVPARIGVEFGVIYTLRGFLATGTTPVRVVFTYPPAGLRNPETGKVSLSSENTFDKPFNAPQMEAYTFENDWEVVPGKWLVQIFDKQKKKLAECAFTVAKD